MRFLSATIIGLLLIFGLSCQGAFNAKCKYNEKGIISYRNSGSIIAFVYVWKPGEYRANPMIKLGDNLISEEIIKKSIEVFNTLEVGGTKCSWCGVSIGVWPEETTQYNCEEGFSFWFSNGDLVGIRIMPESLKKDNKLDIRVNGLSVLAMGQSDYLKLLGDSLKKKSYWSEY